MPATFARHLSAPIAAVNVWAATLSGVADVKNEKTHSERDIYCAGRSDAVSWLLFSDDRYVNMRHSIACHSHRNP